METIKLDLIPGKKMPSLHASQYDDGRDYHIDLTENRVPYTLDGTETISLTVRKCDNTLVTMDIANTFANKSYIEFRTTEQMNACAGFNYGEITIEKNGTQISSLNFYLQVEGAPDEGGITSQSEINNLARQVHDIVVEELADNGASETGYDNTESGLEATNVQDAIDEVNTKIENIPSVDAYTKEQSDEKYATKSELSNKADVSAIPTKTSQLQNDSDFAQIDDTTESASKTYSSDKIGTLLDEKASASEVENIHIGADGTTYSSAGDAVRGQVVKLKNELGIKTYNLVSGRKNGYSIGSNGKINANATTDVISAPVEQGKTYYVLTDESSLICGFFSSNPFADGAVSYNASRTIQNPKYITAPIDGFIAFRVLTGYEYPQISEGESAKPYITPIEAYDQTARAKLSEIDINYDDFTIYNDKYANARDLVLSNYTGMHALEFPVFGRLKFTYKFIVGSVGAFGLYFEDVYGNAFGSMQAQTTTQEITVPMGAVKCYATVNSKADIGFSNLANYLLSRKDSEYTSGLTASSVPLERLNDYTGMLDLFLHVGCIGDSLASGESYWNEGGTVQGNDFYQYSWGQFLARKTGNTYYNWSRGGLMAKTWLESDYATECFDGNHKCEAYIIGLGQNDRNHSVTIGTSADIDLNDYNNNADTFYGNYGKIIQKIKEIQPQAKIFVITDMNPYVERDGYNAPIRDMPNIFDDVYLLDFNTYASKYYKNPIIQAQMRASHYNAYGYKLFSMMIANYIDWYVTTYYSEFREVELIGTGHSWIDN